MEGNHDRENTLTIPVTINERDFSAFALFDAIHHKHVWRLPAIFAAIMCAFSVICFLMSGRVSQGALLGTVLLIVGLGLPLVYFSSFFSMTNRQAKMLRLSKNPTVYTLVLSPGGINVLNKKDTLFHPWEKVSVVYTRKKYTYIYTSSEQPNTQAPAYMIPHRLTDKDALLSLLGESLSEGIWKKQ